MKINYDKKLLLDLDLVPSSSWANNVRTILSKKEWDFIRKLVYEQAKYICEICGSVGKNHPVECHEIWHYDDKKLIQKLIGMIALCPDCHMVKHMGLAQIQNKGEYALNHFMKINKMKKKEAELHINEAFDQWSTRSSKKWIIDISILDQYGIDLSTVKESSLK